MVDVSGHQERRTPATAAGAVGVLVMQRRSRGGARRPTGLYGSKGHMQTSLIGSNSTCRRCSMGDYPGARPSIVLVREAKNI